MVWAPAGDGISLGKGPWLNSQPKGGLRIKEAEVATASNRAGMGRGDVRYGRSRAQWAALIVGAVFLLVGILGFIPGITTNYDNLGFIDQHGAKLLGIFEVNALHNIVHLAFGVLGLALASRHDTARMYLAVGGVVYLVVWIYGAVVDFASSANFIALNTPDNWLHFLLGAGMLALGGLLWRDERLAREQRLATA
jgi:hypothetical protein